MPNAGLLGNLYSRRGFENALMYFDVYCVNAVEFAQAAYSEYQQ